MMKNYFISLVVEIDPDDGEKAKALCENKVNWDYDNYTIWQDGILHGVEDEIQDELIVFVEELEESGLTVTDSWYEILNEDKVVR